MPATGPGTRTAGLATGRSTRAAGLAVGAAVLALAVGCGDGRVSRTVVLGAADRDGHGGRPVLLEALGTGTADIAYGTGTDQVQESEVPLPWRRTLVPEDPSGPLSIMVVSPKPDQIGCRITIAGKVVDAAVSEGVVTTNGTGTIVSCRT